MQRILTLFWLFLLVINACAQEYSFREFSLKSGLPQSQVTAIHQDEDGFLWVGTLGGLSRFDGKNFQTFTIENGLLSNRISFLEFISGKLYVGHEGGLSILTRGNEFLSIPSKSYPENLRFSHIIQFNGRSLVGSNGKGLFELENNKLKVLKLYIHDPEDGEEFQRIRKMAVLGDKIYFATRGGVFFSTDLKSAELIQKTKEWSVSDIVTNNDELILSTYNEGIFRIKPTARSGFYISKISDTESSKIQIQQGHRYGSDFVWALTEKNTILRNKIGLKSDDPSPYSSFELNSIKGLPSESISTLFLDRAGFLWFGTEGRGLFQFMGEAFTRFSLEAPVLSILKDSRNEFWFGTFNGGLIKKNDHSPEIKLPNELKENTIWCSLKDKDGNLWFGSNRGLFILREGKWLVWNTSNQAQISDNKISALHEDRFGNVWIGTRKGVAMVKNFELLDLNNKALKELNFVRDLVTYQNDLIIATKTGLFRFDIQESNLSTINVKKLMPSFTCLYVDKLNTLWIGSEEGLFVFQNDQIKQVNYSNRSSEKFINFIIGLNDNVLAGTNNGIFEFSEYNNELTTYKLRHYDESFGLVGAETNIKSTYIERSGIEKLWFGTSDGLYLFDPQKINPSLVGYRPKVFLSNLEVNFTAFPLPDSGNAIQLNYNQNMLRFVFQILDLYQSDKVQLEYRLQNNEKWSPAGSNSEIIFNQLASGNYKLQVRAIGANGNQSEILSFDFLILQPFYSTWWFFLLLSGILSLMVYAFVRYRIRQIRTQETQERLELVNRLNALEQQILNASMNRHFIFNALNSIQYFINTQDRLSANKYLSQFAQLIRKNLDSSASRENRVTLAEEIERLQLYLSLESMRFSNRFTYTFDLDKNIDLEEVKIPPMLFQPFIENAIIHGILPNEDLNGEIRFTAELRNKEIVFTISDNGVGYSTSLRQKKGHGDHFSHGTSITKSRIEVIRKISGDVINMHGPEDIKDAEGRISGTKVVISVKQN
jgi:ligand-binding sensor domain-containing protein